MNKRSFLAVLGIIVVSPWNVLMRSRKGYKPILEQVFPKSPDELPGLYCHYIYGNQVFPYQIIREFDEWEDRWQGQQLWNPRRNKWWAKDVNGKTELIVTGRCYNDPLDTLFFRKV